MKIGTNRLTYLLRVFQFSSIQFTCEWLVVRWIMSFFQICNICDIFHFSVLLFCSIFLFQKFATEFQRRQKCCRMFWFCVWAFSSTLKIKTFETTSARKRRAGKISLVLNGLNNHQFIIFKFSKFYKNFESTKCGQAFHLEIEIESRTQIKFYEINRAKLIIERCQTKWANNEIKGNFLDYIHGLQTHES